MKGIVKVFLVSYPNTITTSPHGDMYLTIFDLFIGLSFHIFKMWLTCDFYV